MNNYEKFKQMNKEELAEFLATYPKGLIKSILTAVENYDKNAFLNFLDEEVE